MQLHVGFKGDNLSPIPRLPQAKHERALVGANVKDQADPHRLDQVLQSAVKHVILETSRASIDVRVCLLGENDIPGIRNIEHAIACQTEQTERNACQWVHRCLST